MKKRVSGVRNTNFMTLAIIVVFGFFLVMGVGYSYLKESLEIVGKSTIVVPSVDELSFGNSTYNWKVVSSENLENSNQVKYTVKINIVNLDKDVNVWTIMFDAFKTVDIEQSSVVDGVINVDKAGHIIISSGELNKFVAKGDCLDLDVEFVLDSNEVFNIGNLSFNGLLLKNL